MFLNYDKFFTNFFNTTSAQLINKPVLQITRYLREIYRKKVARKKSILEKEVTAKDSSRTKKSNTKVMASAGPSGVSADTSDSGEEINSGLTRAKESQEVVIQKASKGRKTRYAIIKELVNFYPATPEQIPWSHEKRNKLFNSLFSK